MSEKKSRRTGDRLTKNVFEYVLFAIFSAIARILPRSQSLALGKHLGGASRFVLRRRRRIARENLLRTFPGMSEDELQGHLREIFRHIGISSMEMLRLDMFRDDTDLQSLFRFQGLENLQRAYGLKKGVLILSGHIGFWEAGTFFLPRLGFPVDFIAKPMKNPWIDRNLLRAREAAGGRCIDSRHAARKIVRSLAENRGVAVLLDQHTSKKQAISVDFFGRPAYTTPVIAQLAMKNGVPVVPVFCCRTADNHYEVRFEPMILLPNDAAGGSVVANTALLTGSIEAAVRRNLDQWFWVHRRWRDIPEAS